MKWAESGGSAEVISVGSGEGLGLGGAATPSCRGKVETGQAMAPVPLRRLTGEEELLLKVENGGVLAHSQRHMKRFGVILMAVALVTGVFGCRPSATSAPPVATNAVPVKVKPKGTPQPKLPVIKLNVGGKVLVTEIADTDSTRQTGMMFRESMGENEAMVFVFPYPHQASFWMRNTLVPLDAAYIDPQGVILEIHKLEPLNEASVRARSSQIQYVLETPQGWFARNGVKAGALVETEQGPLTNLLKTNK